MWRASRPRAAALVGSLVFLALLAAPSFQVRADEDPFIIAMSQGHAALAGEDFPAAKAAFERALELRPGAAAALDGLAQAELELRRREIVALREAAVAFEAEESWERAGERYGEVLEIDPTVVFAQEGRTRARARAELAERLAFYLEHPDRLADTEVLGEARTALDEAREIESPGPRHRRQTAELAKLTGEWGEALRVDLRSDGQTEVVIYRVGRFGTFTERRIDLRPGTYTVVGTRSGFRDVRHRLVIEPGVEPPPLRVICEEQL